jgi:hypothetical protein
VRYKMSFEMSVLRHSREGLLARPLSRIMMKEQ